MNSLIIKVLGASFPTYIIHDQINRIWRPKDPLKLIPLSNDYFIVSFSNKQDHDYAFQEGPWMIEDHYLIVQRWRPNFNPWKADLQRNIAAWIRFPDVPFEFYNVESLRRIGNMDQCPSASQKDEGDLNVPKEVVGQDGGDDRHNTGGENGVRLETGVESVGDVRDDGRIRMKKGVYSGGGSTIITGDKDFDACPFGKIQILRRESRGAPFTADSKQSKKVSSGHIVDQSIRKETMPQDHVNGGVNGGKELKLEVNATKGEVGQERI
ncbi:hypothetical protein K1719_010856 [Acacia pycnantha]|nr:hypothetical protein K1719_010856 [Acacia pycnantha]